VNHLVADCHHARRLHDAVAVAVDDAQHGADDATGDAAIVQREVFGCVERAVTERAAVARGTALLGGGRNRRLPAIRRIDDERRLTERTACVVAAERADGVQCVLDALLRLLLTRRPLLLALIEAGDVLRPLHRDALRVVARPHALKIRVAPRRFRRRVWLVRCSAVVGSKHERGSGRSLAQERYGPHRCDSNRRRDPNSYECTLRHHLLLAPGMTLNH
jgi:hypothetical protein